MFQGNFAYYLQKNMIDSPSRTGGYNKLTLKKRGLILRRQVWQLALESKEAMSNFKYF